MSPSLPDPYVNEGGWAGVQRNFDAIMRLLLDTGGQSLSLRVGTTQLTWTGAATLSAVQTVPHNLGKTPAIVLATVGGVGSGAGFSVMAGNLGATTFQLQGWANGAPAASFAAYWLVIG